MKLESLKFRSGNLFYITVSGFDGFYLEDISVYRLGLKEGMEISEELFEKMKQISSEEGAKRVAARLLSSSRKTVFELKQKLRQKGFDGTSIDAAAEMFIKNGFLNDREFAASYVNDAVNFKKYSVRQIKQKLMQKGIAGDIINEACADLEDNNQLKRLVEKEMEKCPDKKGIEKLKRRLYSKGFSLGDIIKAVGEFENEA